MNQRKITYINTIPAGSGGSVVSLDDVKEWCIVETDEHDNLLSNLIRQTISAMEKYTKRLFRPTGVVFVVKIVGVTDIPFPRQPVREVLSIEQLNGDEYTAIEDTDFSVIDQTLRIKSCGTFRITYDGGYDGDLYQFDEDLKIAVLTQVAYRFENRGDKDLDTGLCTMALDYLEPYKIMAWP